MEHGEGWSPAQSPAQSPVAGGLQPQSRCLGGPELGGEVGGGSPAALLAPQLTHTLQPLQATGSDVTAPVSAGTPRRGGERGAVLGRGHPAGPRGLGGSAWRGRHRGCGEGAGSRGSPSLGCVSRALRCRGSGRWQWHVQWVAQCPWSRAPWHCPTWTSTTGTIYTSLEVLEGQAMFWAGVATVGREAASPRALRGDTGAHVSARALPQPGLCRLPACSGVEFEAGAGQRPNWRQSGGNERFPRKQAGDSRTGWELTVRIVAASWGAPAEPLLISQGPGRASQGLPGAPARPPVPGLPACPAPGLPCAGWPAHARDRVISSVLSVLLTWG